MSKRHKRTDEEKAALCTFAAPIPNWSAGPIKQAIVRLIRRERAEARRETEARIKAMLGQGAKTIHPKLAAWKD